jgi:hypothetical protein
MLDDLIDEMSARVVQKIQEAFATNQYPGDDNLVEDSSYWESINLSDQLKGKDWREISLETLKKNRFSLSLFTPEAFRYYLPAFIIASVLHADEVDTLPSSVFHNLTPPEGEGLDMDEFLKRNGDFNALQREAIREFIKLYVTVETSYPDPKRERATRFWKESENSPISNKNDCT